MLGLGSLVVLMALLLVLQLSQLTEEQVSALFKGLFTIPADLPAPSKPNWLNVVSTGIFVICGIGALIKLSAGLKPNHEFIFLPKHTVFGSFLHPAIIGGYIIWFSSKIYILHPKYEFVAGTFLGIGGSLIAYWLSHKFETIKARKHLEQFSVYVTNHPEHWAKIKPAILDICSFLNPAVRYNVDFHTKACQCSISSEILLKYYDAVQPLIPETISRLKKDGATRPIEDFTI